MQGLHGFQRLRRLSIRRLHPLDHLLQGALLQFGDPLELRQHLLLHAGGEPGGEKSEGQAGVVVVDDGIVLLRQLAVPQHRIQAEGHDPAAGAPLILLIDLAAGGVIDMQRGALFLHGGAHHGGQALLQRADRRKSADDGLGLIVDDLLQQLRDARIVVVEGVAVDAAHGDDVLHRDLGDRPLIQQLYQRRLDGAACEICHENFPLHT